MRTLMKTPSRLSHKLADQIRFLLITKSSSPSKISSTECKIKGIVIKVKITPIGIPIKTNQQIIIISHNRPQIPFQITNFSLICKCKIKIIYVLCNHHRIEA